MVDAGELHLFCGKMASGKSTLARQIADAQTCILLAEDALLAALYPGEITTVATYARCAERVRTAIRRPAIGALQRGVSVVLDFPANTVAQRNWLAGLAFEAGSSYWLHYLPRSDEHCKAQLALRAAGSPERRITDTVEMFDAMAVYFEPPGTAEGLRVVAHEYKEQIGIL